MSDIKVSVRLMVYNNESYIEEALNGLLCQEVDFTYEIVIGDDFSTDATATKLQKYALSFPKIIRLLKRSKGDEYYIKRSKGNHIVNYIDILENCKGKYIALLDGDDYWTDPYKLQKQVDFLETNQQYSICWTNYKELLGNSECPVSNSWEMNLNISDLYEVSFDNFCSPYNTYTLTCMFRKDVLDNVNLTDFRYFKDNTLYSICLNKGKGALLNFHSAVYRKHEGGIWSGSNAYKRAFADYTNYAEILSKIPASRTPNMLRILKYWKGEFDKELKNQPLSLWTKMKTRLELFLYFCTTKNIT